MTGNSTIRRCWHAFKTYLRWVFISWPLIVGLLFAYLAMRPAWDRTKLNQLTPGMTHEQVRAIAGDPTDTYCGYWVYERVGNGGWVEIHFDPDGRMLFVNDESVFPP